MAPRRGTRTLVVGVVVLVLLAAGAGVAIYRYVSGGARVPVAVFLGDSYTQGVGASRPERRWTTLVSGALDWQEHNAGLGGTGYLAISGPRGCGKPECPAYPSMVEVAVATHPQIVVVAGGQNDFTAFRRSPDQVRAMITLTYESLRRRLPDAQLVAIGPSTTGSVDGSVRAFDAAVQQAASAVGARYISLIDPPAIASSMVLADRAHVNDAGHAAIAQRVIAGLRGIAAR